jgi:hypothetical protein
MIRVTLEGDGARYMLHAVNQDRLTLTPIADGVTLRDLNRYGISARDVDGLRIGESRDFNTPAPDDKPAHGEGRVTANLYGAREEASIPDHQLAVAHARMGYPVEVRIARGNNAHVLNLTENEARALAAQLAPIVRAIDG